VIKGSRILSASIYYGGDIDAALKGLQVLPYLMVAVNSTGGAILSTKDGIKGKVILHRNLPDTNQSKAEINFRVSGDVEASQRMQEIRDILLGTGFDV